MKTQVVWFCLVTCEHLKKKVGKFGGILLSGAISRFIDLSSLPIDIIK